LVLLLAFGAFSLSGPMENSRFFKPLSAHNNIIQKISDDDMIVIIRKGLKAHCNALEIAFQENLSVSD